MPLINDKTVGHPIMGHEQAKNHKTDDRESDQPM